MPIVITVAPGRVEQVAFTGFTPAQRAIESALWPAIASLVDQLDEELRRINEAVRRGLAQEDQGLNTGETGVAPERDRPVTEGGRSSSPVNRPGKRSDDPFA